MLLTLQEGGSPLRFPDRSNTKAVVVMGSYESGITAWEVQTQSKPLPWGNFQRSNCDVVSFKASESPEQDRNPPVLVVFIWHIEGNSPYLYNLKRMFKIKPEPWNCETRTQFCHNNMLPYTWHCAVLCFLNVTQNMCFSDSFAFR